MKGNIKIVRDTPYTLKDIKYIKKLFNEILKNKKLNIVFTNEELQSINNFLTFMNQCRF